MRKMSVLFDVSYEDNVPNMKQTIREENEWVFDEGVTVSRKFDGTSCAIIDSELYKRWDNKKGKPVPKGAVECQSKDPVTGHHPYWIPCLRNDPSNIYHFEAFDSKTLLDGTYELCGPKIQGNPEYLGQHMLILHGSFSSTLVVSSENIDYTYLKQLLTILNYEGIVFKHPDGRMCKLRKVDFGLKKPQ